MERVMKFDQYLKIYEDGEGGGAGDGGGPAGVNLGNIGGMNAIVPPVPSTTPGQVWTGDPTVDYAKGKPGGTGSGDLPAYDKGKKFEPVKNKKELKKKNAKGEVNPYGWDKGYQSMYVTSFANWSDAYGKNTVK